MSAATDGERTGGPLAGVRVIDLSVNVLGPVATQILGDLGADVIKIETPSGDPNRDTGPYRNPGMAAMHMNVNRNKRSVTLNLKQPSAREALMRLVDDADVFVHSMRPAAATRLGVSYKAIAARNPRIIYAFGPGYRQDGPRRDDPAFDDVVQGESGIAALVAQVIGEPRYYPTVIVDKFCGYMLASSIGMALFHRERTGQGQEVQVPMYETILSFNYLGSPVERSIRSADGSRRGLCASVDDAPSPLQNEGRLHLRACRERRSMAPIVSSTRPARARRG